MEGNIDLVIFDLDGVLRRGIDQLMPSCLRKAGRQVAGSVLTRFTKDQLPRDIRLAQPTEFPFLVYVTPPGPNRNASEDLRVGWVPGGQCEFLAAVDFIRRKTENGAAHDHAAAPGTAKWPAQNHFGTCQ